jgi:hypothetical protein
MTGSNTNRDDLYLKDEAYLRGKMVTAPICDVIYKKVKIGRISVGK